MRPHGSVAPLRDALIFVMVSAPDDLRIGARCVGRPVKLAPRRIRAAVHVVACTRRRLGRENARKHDVCTSPRPPSPLAASGPGRVREIWAQAWSARCWWWSASPSTGPLPRGWRPGTVRGEASHREEGGPSITLPPASDAHEGRRAALSSRTAGARLGPPSPRSDLRILLDATREFRGADAAAHASRRCTGRTRCTWGGHRVVDLMGHLRYGWDEVGCASDAAILVQRRRGTGRGRGPLRRLRPAAHRAADRSHWCKDRAQHRQHLGGTRCSDPATRTARRTLAAVVRFTR